jgi:hypothetical protein
MFKTRYEFLIEFFLKRRLKEPSFKLIKSRTATDTLTLTGIPAYNNSTAKTTERKEISYTN